MIYTIEDKKLMADMPHEPMSKHISRKVEIYRSADPESTRKYFESFQMKDGLIRDSYFELVVFTYMNNMHQVYLRYPGCESFIELFGGAGRSWGLMESYVLRDVVMETLHPYVYEAVLQPRTINIFKNKNSAMIQFRSDDFDFLKRVACAGLPMYDDPNNSNYTYGQEYLDAAFARDYIPLADKRRIESAYYTEDGDTVIVDASAYNYSYDTLRCFYGNVRTGIRQGDMFQFERYRDGGTTLFDVVLDGKTHHFYSPTPFNPDLQATWNGKPMVMIPTEDLAVLVKSLNIDLVEEVAR